jgi:hypothetical protein
MPSPSPATSTAACPLVPDQPTAATAYLSAPPLCSDRLLQSIANEYQRNPPPMPAWHAFASATASHMPVPLRLRNVIASVTAFLSPRDLSNVACVALAFSPGPLFLEVQVFPPWPPLHSRLFGARKRTPLRCARHDKPSPFLVFHHCWAYLHPHEWRSLCVAYPIMREYAKL